MLEPIGFWSYGRLDDENSDGRLSALRKLVGAEINLRCGRRASLWQDIAAIPHGANWQAEIDKAIAQTTFYIPVITPRYLQSKHCHKEYLAFRDHMLAMGRDDLIFPIHYVSIDRLDPAKTEFAEDMDLLLASQWSDFRPLMYDEMNASAVRRWAGGLAESVVAALRREVKARVILPIEEREPTSQADRATPTSTEAESSAKHAPVVDPVVDVIIAPENHPAGPLSFSTAGVPATNINPAKVDEPLLLTDHSIDDNTKDQVVATSSASKRRYLKYWAAVIVPLISSGLLFSLWQLQLSPLSPCEGELWRATMSSKEAEDFQKFLDQCPTSSHVGAAHRTWASVRADDKAWADARSADILDGYEHYMRQFPTGKRGRSPKDELKSFGKRMTYGRKLSARRTL